MERWRVGGNYLCAEDDGRAVRVVADVQDQRLVSGKVNVLDKRCRTPKTLIRLRCGTHSDFVLKQAQLASR